MYYKLDASGNPLPQVSPVCEYCGRRNKDDRVTCWSCGAGLPEIDYDNPSCFIPAKDVKWEHVSSPSPYFISEGW